MYDVIERINKTQTSLLDELDKMKPNDPNFKYVADNVKTLGDAKASELKEENSRHNNNEVNDINRMNAEIANEKLKVEKLKIGAGVASDILDVIKCSGYCWIAYNGDKVAYAVRSCIEVAKKFIGQRRH